MNLLKMVKITILTILLMQIQCSSGCGIAGSETTNGISVTVADCQIKGSTCADAMVYCFSTDFNPDKKTGFADSVKADKTGKYEFNTIDNSTYNVYSYSKELDSVAIIQNLNRAISVNDTFTGYKLCSKISGVTSDVNGLLPGATVYILGTCFKTISGESGKFLFKSIPPGVFMIESYCQGRLKGTVSVSKEVIISEINNSNNAIIRLNLE